MADCYGEGAGVEVLLRAFLEERDMNPDAVRFWLKVYEALRSLPTPDPDATPAMPPIR